MTNNIIDINQSNYFEPINGLRAKVAHTESHTYAFWEIDKGTILPEHLHIHKQISIVTKGQLELTVDGKTTIIRKGMMAIIPSNCLHSAKAITEVELTDIFNPIG